MSYIVPEPVEDYAADRSEGFDPLLDELVQATYARTEYPGMLSGKLGGGVLRMVARLIGARRCLEVGMFTGFSALCVAEALPEGGVLDTCEIDPEVVELARSFFARSPHGKKIRVHLGPASETLAGLEGPYDMAFVDADKTGYPHYYEECLRLLRPGGALLIDNALWSGRVLDPRDESSAVLDGLNRRIEADERVDRLLLTVRDGIFLLRKRP